MDSEGGTIIPSGKGIYVYVGYDANSGFYNDKDEWTEFPEEVKNKLRFLTILGKDWKRRLRYLFKNKIEL